MPNALGVAFGVPELIEGITNAGKDMKKELNRETNKYDARLGVNSAKMPIQKTAEDDDIKKYIIPAALLGATVARGRMTGNMMQLPFYDIPNIIGKAAPKMPDTIIKQISKNKGINRNARVAAKAVRNSNISNSFSDQLKSGAGFAAGMAGVDMAVNKMHEKKASVEVKGARGYLKKVVREGILHPAIQSVPLYATPVAVSYALNKDIKGGFAPVRDNPEYKDKHKKIDSSSTDYRSRNNIVNNETILKFAKFSPSSAYKKMNETTFRIKPWNEFLSELPGTALRSVSLAVPMSMMAQSDPVEKYKGMMRAEQQQKHDKDLVRQAVKKQKAEIRKARKNGGI